MDLLLLEGIGRNDEKESTHRKGCVVCCLDSLTAVWQWIALASLHHIKLFVAQHLSDASLNPSTVASVTGLSTRYINMLFDNENTSLMRYVLTCRLKRCYDDL